MKTRIMPILLAVVLAVEIIALVLFAMIPTDTALDAVDVNEALHSVARDFTALSEHENATGLDYVVLSPDGRVLYRTRSGLSESISAAISHCDLILDIERDGDIVGKLIVQSGSDAALAEHKQTAVTVLTIAMALSAVICICYTVYLHKSIIAPFGKLKGFAERIACGNLDVPLEMDRTNVFGAFTESFDIMRSELKAARLAEAQAQKSKKELVAKLSHDIKTPVASIKATAELGLARADEAKTKDSYAVIIAKADQINTLIGNLFSATLEELEKITVSPTYIPGTELGDMLSRADYLDRAVIPEIPECLIYADKLRLQQVFDNIFFNSYKYADTDITVTATRGDALEIRIEDCGGGVLPEELPLLKEKYRRGSNTAQADGAGLGLYISDYFMKEMGGALKLENGEHGLAVTVVISQNG